MRIYDRALIIDDPWISLILDGKKTLEMRSKPTKIRGRIGLIKKGTGHIFGDAWLDECVDIGKNNLLEVFGDCHCIDYRKNPELRKYKYAWRLERVNKYYNPVPYKHPQGAVIWVKV